MDATRPIEKILSHLAAVKESGKGWTARCPAHEDKERSLSVRERHNGKALIKCFAGCEVPAILEAVGLRLRDLFPSNSSAGSSEKNISLSDLANDKGLPEDFLKELGVTPAINEYGKNIVRIVYRLEDGTEAPRMRIRTALKAKKGSLWTKGEGDIVPYGLWKLTDGRQAHFMILVEGESDCWTLWHHGFPALGIPGAALAKSIQADHLKDIPRIYVFREPDQGGIAFVKGVARRLKDIGWGGNSFEMKLDGVKDPNELHKRDPAVFKELFQKALDSAIPMAEPPQEAAENPRSDSKLPYIYAGEGNLKKITAECWAALIASNSPEYCFRYGNLPVRIEHNDEGRPIIREITQDGMRHVVARVADFYKVNRKKKEVPAMPPLAVIKDMLATPDMPLPILTRIVEAPVFSADGQLQVEPGYHSASRTYYAPAPGFTVPAVPEVISPTEINKARGVLDDLLCDFPFVRPSEKANSAGFMFLMHCRDMIDGPTPLHLVEAPSPGTGKGLLTEAMTYPALGHSMSTMTEGRDEDEWRKRITAKLRSGPVIMVLDNLRRRLDSAALAAVVTAPFWEDRILGSSHVASMPVKCAWLATGNNPTLSNEITRRTVRIRMDAKIDRPWLRNGFRYPNLREWVKQHRADIVWAVLVLIAAWIQAVRPLYKARTLGMFESWAEGIGGILQVTGINGFLDNLEEFYEESDAETSTWRVFIHAWWEKHGDTDVGVSDLFDLANSLDEAFDLGQGSEKSQRTRLGRELVQMRDRQFGEHRIVLAGERQRAKRWKLVLVTPPQAGEPVNISEPFPPQVNSDPKIENQDPICKEGENSSPTFTGSLPLNIPAPSDNGFDEHEKALLQYYSEKELEAVKLAKSHFPGCRVVDVVRTSTSKNEESTS